MKFIKERKSISSQLTVLVVVALIISAIWFFAAHTIGTYFLNEYLNGTGYVERVAGRYYDDFEAYVKEGNIKSNDTEALNKWFEKQEIIYLDVYSEANDEYIYFSDEPLAGKTTNTDIWAEMETYDRVVEFEDGEFHVGMFGNYTYKFFYYELGITLVSAFAIFFIILMIGLRRTITDIKTLRDEIDILEGGNLEYEITTEGNNELADLASSVEALKKSILKQFETEAELRQYNSKMITDLSHDIRTPLTTMMIYLEAIKHGKCKDEESLYRYLTRIEEKMEQMKHLTDTILEYSLETNTSSEKEALQATFKELFFGRISGFVECLDNSGFTVEADIQWYDSRLTINEDDMDRMLDNILSNIMKYADKNCPITIKTKQNGKIEIAFENGKNVLQTSNKTTEENLTCSHRLGINNIQTMMNKIHGECRVNDTDDMFKITLIFPVYEKREG